MSRFTGDLTVTQMSGSAGSWRRWRLHEALVYEVGDKGTGRLIVVPPGFVSDGPSIPRVFWAIMPVWGTWGRAGILHDFLCARLAMGRPHREGRTRLATDAVFYESMVALRVGFLTRWAMYAGVRVGALLGVRTRMIDFNDELLHGESEGA